MSLQTNISDSFFSSTFSFLFISRVWFLGQIFNGSIMVVWTRLFLFCVTPDAYWCILIRFFGILVLQTFYLAFFLCMPARRADGLNMAYGKPLMVMNMFSNFSTWTAFWIPHG